MPKEDKSVNNEGENGEKELEKDENKLEPKDSNSQIGLKKAKTEAEKK